MTPIELPDKLPDDGLLDNLPLLTQVADEDAPDELPTLTEIVASGQAEPVTDREVSTLENEASHAHFLHPYGHGALCPYPTDEGANESLREFHVNEEELQRLLLRLEAHLENVFAHKLSVNLEQLQRQAIEQAVSELKAELPGLLHDALKAHPEL